MSNNSAAIEESGWPLVFRVGDGLFPDAQVSDGMTGVRMLVRSLTGMQKEALVSVAGAPAWRMVSDEGPYLNGTDLAPFPLAFFTAGMQFSLLSELLTAARAADVRLRSVTIDCDNRYSMEGSFLRGDAIGGAMPADIAVRLDGDLDATQGQRLIATAERGCPAQGLIRAALSNRFALRLDGRPIELAELSACDPVTPTLFEEVFAVAAPQPGDPAIIKKLRAAEAIAGVEGGAGSSLQAVQKWTLHVRGRAHWLGGFRAETKIQLLHPIGSTFRFVSDESAERGGDETAPPPLAYLNAGVGFCYMTQLGRLAHIRRQPLESYAIGQDSGFARAADTDASSRVAVGPFNTTVDLRNPAVEMLQQGLDEPHAADLVRMGQRTCFLHAAMRGSYPSKLELTDRN